jgi:hypothetical protein
MSIPLRLTRETHTVAAPRIIVSAPISDLAASAVVDLVKLPPRTWVRSVALVVVAPFDDEPAFSIGDGDNPAGWRDDGDAGDYTGDGRYYHAQSVISLTARDALAGGRAFLLVEALDLDGVIE